MGVKWSDHELQVIEADFGFGPVQIYYRPLNIRERRLVAAAQELSITDFAVESLVLRSRNESGVRLWPSQGDRDLIEREFDPDEMDRVIGLMYTKADTAGN